VGEELGNYGVSPNIAELFKQRSLLPEGGDESGSTTKPAQRTASAFAELPQIPRADVGQLVMLPVTPEVFDRIQFRSVGWQVLDLNFAFQAASPSACWCFGPVRRSGPNCTRRPSAGWVAARALWCWISDSNVV
jgi:hypothetical protein